MSNHQSIKWIGVNIERKTPLHITVHRRTRNACASANRADECSSSYIDTAKLNYNQLFWYRAKKTARKTIQFICTAKPVLHTPSSEDPLLHYGLTRMGRRTRGSLRERWRESRFKFRAFPLTSKIAHSQLCQRTSHVFF